MGQVKHQRKKPTKNLILCSKTDQPTIERVTFSIHSNQKYQVNLRYQVSKPSHLYLTNCPIQSVEGINRVYCPVLI